MKRYVVEICIGTPCHLMGAQDLIKAVQSLPKERLAEIQLKTCPCLQACAQGPAVRINGEIMAPVTPAELVRLLTTEAPDVE